MNCQGPQVGLSKTCKQNQKVTPETLHCQSERCCKYLLQLNEQRRCLHSDTHLEDKWICPVQKGDKCHRRGRLRLCYLWGLSRLSLVEKGKDRERQDSLPVPSYLQCSLFIPFLLFTLSFPLHPPPPFYSSFLQLPQLLALPHLSFCHLLHSTKLTSSVSRSTDACPWLHQESSQTAAGKAELPLASPRAGAPKTSSMLP